ncbi:MAG: hypothetical protein M3413_01330 [Bacteroidota bacterium]|jgi:hypothetical protein|nr:hypothetical protein [Bacteroidota bacterium]
MERNKISSTDNRVNGTLLHEDQIEPFATSELSRDFSSVLNNGIEISNVEDNFLSVNNNHQIVDEDEDDDELEDDLILGDEDELKEDDEKEVADVEIDEDFDEDDLDEDDLILDADDAEEDEEDDL